MAPDHPHSHPGAHIELPLGQDVPQHAVLLSAAIMSHPRIDPNANTADKRGVLRAAAHARYQRHQTLLAQMAAVLGMTEGEARALVEEQVTAFRTALPLAAQEYRDILSGHDAISEDMLGVLAQHYQWIVALANAGQLTFPETLAYLATMLQAEYPHGGTLK